MTSPDVDPDTPLPAEDDGERATLNVTPGRFYATVVERLPVGVQVWRFKPARDPSSARLVATNPAAARLTGVPIEASLGRAMADAFPAFCRQGVAAALADILERRRTRVLGPFQTERAGAPQAQVLLRGFRLPNRCVGVTIEIAHRRSPTSAPP